MEPRTDISPQQRRKLLILPLLVLPFVTMVFWALGGGTAETTADPYKGKGLNTALPAANLLAEQPDKMQLYQQQRADSERRMAEQQASGYNQWTNPALEGGVPLELDSTAKLPQDNRPESSTEPLAAVEAQLTALEKHLQQLPGMDTPPFSLASQIGRPVPQTTTESDMEEEGASTGRALQHLYDTVATATATIPDPELQKLDEMLDKLMRMQQPEAAPDLLQARSAAHKKQVFAVRPDLSVPIATLMGRQGTPDTLMENPQPVTVSRTTTGFYTLMQGQSREKGFAAGIKAVVREKQTLTPGARLKLCLLQPVYISGLRMPKGHPVYGICRLENTRMRVHIQHIRYKDRIFPVQLEVYGLDGQEGLYVPDRRDREELKNQSVQGIQSLQLLQTDPSLAAQMAETGISGLKGWLGRKVRKVQVTVEQGFCVLLVDKKNL